MVVRDRVRSVVLGYTTGFFLYGEGGNCKSFTVVQELERLRADYKLHNSRMTGRGLFDVLRNLPDSIHLLEDVEGLFRDPMAQGVLRSALWGQRRDGEQERLVTWNAYKTNLHSTSPGDHRHQQPPAGRPARVACPGARGSTPSTWPARTTRSPP